jgi:hypothetical protein
MKPKNSLFQQPIVLWLAHKKQLVTSQYLLYTNFNTKTPENANQVEIKKKR